jgi:hypothetical protein
LNGILGTVNLLIPCEKLSGVDGIKSEADARWWDYLWADAVSLKGPDTKFLAINPRGIFRDKAHAHIHFCEYSWKGFDLREQLKPLCGMQDNKWQQLSVAKCSEAFASPTSGTQIFSMVQYKFGADLSDVGISVFMDICEDVHLVLGSRGCSIVYDFCEKM